MNLSIEDRVVNTYVAHNVFANNLYGGVKAHKQATGTRVEHNRIGLTTNGTPASNGPFGIQAELGVTDMTIGPGNTIAHNSAGVRILDPDTLRIRVTANSIYSNGGLGIDISPLGTVNQNDGGDSDTGPNTMLNWPSVTTVSATSVAGTACAGCRVGGLRRRLHLHRSDIHQLLRRGPRLAGQRHGEHHGFVHRVDPLQPDQPDDHIVGAHLGRQHLGVLTQHHRARFERGESGQPPTAVFSVACNRLSCSFDASSSSDVDGTITSHTWSFGDGTVGTGRTVSHTFPASGTYQVTLTATDDKGATASVTCGVKVRAKRASR